MRLRATGSCRWMLAALLAAALAAATTRDPTEGGFASPDGWHDNSQWSRAALASLTGIERALTYYGKHWQSVNLDGAIGIRMVEGQFGALLDRYKTKMPSWMAHRMTKLRQYSAMLADSVVQSVRKSTPEYFANAGDVVSKHFWTTYFSTRRLSPASRSGSRKQENTGFHMTEKFSDDCAKEFTGKDGQPPCSISQHCWKAMAMNADSHEYYLTHQLLYLIGGIQKNCSRKLTAMATRTEHLSGAAISHLGKTPMLSLIDDKCARILSEAIQIENLNFPTELRDLFMEQIAVCGIAGYTGIAKLRWLPHVIGWQRAKSGCYGTFPGEAGPPPSSNSYGHTRRRRKRAEAPLGSNGCLSHRTSVALGALTIYVRRAIEEQL